MLILVMNLFQALEIQANDKTCLVARSKCYLKLGDPVNALADAEASLEEDKYFHKVRHCWNLVHINS